MNASVFLKKYLNSRKWQDGIYIPKIKSKLIQQSLGGITLVLQNMMMMMSLMMNASEILKKANEFLRNYFGPSEHDDDDELDDERERVLEEVAELKKVAGWHLYPESKIDVDPTTFARNYYSLLAPVEDDLEEEG